LARALAGHLAQCAGGPQLRLALWDPLLSLDAVPVSRPGRWPWRVRRRCHRGSALAASRPAILPVAAECLALAGAFLSRPGGLLVQPFRRLLSRQPLRRKHRPARALLLGPAVSGRG